MYAALYFSGRMCIRLEKHGKMLFGNRGSNIMLWQ